MFAKLYGHLALAAAKFLHKSLPDELDPEEISAVLTVVFGDKVPDHITVAVIVRTQDEDNEAMEMKEQWGLDDNMLPIHMLN